MGGRWINARECPDGNSRPAKGGRRLSSGGASSSSGGVASSGSSSGARDAGAGEGGTSYGGPPGDAGSCQQATDCKGALPQICAQCGNGTVACAHFECENGACVTVLCPPGSQDAGNTQCGASVCPSGDRCCDHCTGSCVSAASNVACPDDSNPAVVCANATCAQSGGSCLNTECCAGLHCCASNAHSTSQATCSSTCPTP